VLDEMVKIRCSVLGGAVATLLGVEPHLVGKHVALQWCGDPPTAAPRRKLDVAAWAGVVGDDDIDPPWTAANEPTDWLEAARHDQLVMCHADAHAQNVHEWSTP